MTRTRRVVQLGFLALTLVGVFVVQGNAERWCPFGGVEALYTYATEGNMTCSLGTSNFFILGGVLLGALLVRRAFCGYACPIGTISEWLGVAARRLRLPQAPVPYRLDRVLAGAKYVVLAVILVATWRAGELLFRGYDPCYALISRHGVDITAWAYVAAGAVAVASLATALPFCRWFCPLAAVLNPFSRFGLTRIKREAASCTECGRCSRACPMVIPVEQVEQVTAARCIACMTCVETCPKRESGALAWGPADWMGRRWHPTFAVVLLLACTGAAVSAAYLFPLPSYVKSRPGTPPEEVAAVSLIVENLTCRGRANLLFWYLDRDDVDHVPGWFRLEAWPSPGPAEVRVVYDPARTDERAVKRAITEWYYDDLQGRWRESPFRIQGYDPLDDARDNS